jgi:hypothetical protein
MLDPEFHITKNLFYVVIVITFYFFKKNILKIYFLIFKNLILKLIIQNNLKIVIFFKIQITKPQFSKPQICNC